MFNKLTKRVSKQTRVWVAITQCGYTQCLQCYHIPKPLCLSNFIGMQATDTEESTPQSQHENEAVQQCSQQHPAATEAPFSQLHPPSAQAAALLSPSQTHPEPLPPEQHIQQQSASVSTLAGSLTDESKQELLEHYSAAQQKCRQTVDSIQPLADLPQCSGGAIVRAEVCHCPLHVSLSWSWDAARFAVATGHLLKALHRQIEQHCKVPATCQP